MSMSHSSPTETALAALSALAHAHRLAAHRALVVAGPAGMTAGAIADALGLPQSSLSFHLAHLVRAGLATQRRASRQMIYAADFGAVTALVGYLTENCCGGADCTANAASEPARRAA